MDHGQKPPGLRWLWRLPIALSGAQGRRPILSLIACGVLLIVVIDACAWIFVAHQRQRALRSAEREIGSLGLILAKQIGREFQTLEFVENGLADQLQARRTESIGDYVQRLSDHEINDILKEKAASLPHVGSLTLVNAAGKVINFSRAWPVPGIDVTDRDFYVRLRDDPKAKSFVSAPVYNRANGSLVVHMAQRLKGPTGEFAGLITGAVDIPYFDRFFKTLTPREGIAIGLYRNDGTLLARQPSEDMRPGDVFPLGDLFAGITASNPFVQSRDYPRDGFSDQLIFAHSVGKYPLIVMITSNITAALADWQSSTMFLVAALAVLNIVVGAIVMLCMWQFRNHESILTSRTQQAESERARAIAEAEMAHEHERVAEAASQAKSAFLAMMSHEIRTPMNAVLGLATTLLETPLDAEQRKSVEAISESGDNLLYLLNDILDFSKLEAGKLELETLAFSPESIVDQSVSIAGVRAAQQGIGLRMEIEPGLPVAVSGDPGRIRQVILNLATNAVKFTADGEVVLGVRCLSRDDKQAVLEWWIRDTGIGMSEEQIAKLFSHYIQADTSIARRFGGSGLGLAICKRILGQMGGDISVASTPNAGSTFSFRLTLPLADASELQAHLHQASAVDLNAMLAELGRPMRVLIAEDNPTNQFVVRKMLGEFKLSLHLASNGAEAVKSAVSFKPDVIFMDMRMPEVDGLAATRQIRAMGGGFATLPICALTANAFADDIRSCREAGMNDFIAKPIRKALLVNKLAQIATLLGASERDPDEPSPSIVPDDAPAGAADAVKLAFPLIDRDVVATLIEEIDADGADATLQMFLSETQSRLQTMRSLDDMRERNCIRTEAHTLKGASGTFGFRRLANAAAELEHAAGSISTRDYKAALVRIEQIFADVCAELAMRPLVAV